MHRSTTRPRAWAAFAVIREGDYIWTVTRTKGATDPSELGLPGGKLELGETALEATIREAEEEGLRVRGDGAFFAPGFCRRPHRRILHV